MAKEYYRDILRVFLCDRDAIGIPMEDLRALQKAGLTRAYLGVETGSDTLLKEIVKVVTAEEMLLAGTRLPEAGLEPCVMVLLGLTGAAAGWSVSGCGGDDEPDEAQAPILAVICAGTWVSPLLGLEDRALCPVHSGKNLAGGVLPSSQPDGGFSLFYLRSHVQLPPSQGDAQRRAGKISGCDRWCTGRRTAYPPRGQSSGVSASYIGDLFSQRRKKF